MKVNHILLSALLLSSMVSCDGNDITPEVPDTPEQPTEGYQFTFGGSTYTDEEATRASWTDASTTDKNKLIFGWDYTDKSNPTYEMKMAFLDAQGTPLTSTKGQNYSDITIMKHSTKTDDSHWAEFETVERYANPLKTYDGHTLVAVNGKSSTVQTSPFAMQLAMPNTFTQQAANSLAHLSDYMYMYATATIKNGDATGLQFKHLTAPVRFRIHNWRPCEAKIYSVEMSVADNGSLTSSTVSVASNGPAYSSTNTHSAITVKAADNAYFSIAERSKKEYIDLYAHVLPLSNDNSLEGKTLRFTLQANDIVTGEEKVEYLTLDNITAEAFYKATGSYNWKAGDLYTFHIYLDDAIKEITIESVSIKEWVNEDLGESETI